MVLSEDPDLTKTNFITCGKINESIQWLLYSNILYFKWIKIIPIWQIQLCQILFLKFYNFLLQDNLQTASRKLE